MKEVHLEWEQMTRQLTGFELLSFRALTSWGTFLALLAISLLAIGR